MKERNGVRVGQRVRDLDGHDLGRVTGLHDGGFDVARGFLLFRKDRVARYDEVRGERDGALVLARSDRDLFDLARGEIPVSWRVPAPSGFPATATPSEARDLFRDIATGVVTGDGAVVAPRPGAGATPPVTDRDEGRYVASREQASAPNPPHS